MKAAKIKEFSQCSTSMAVVASGFLQHFSSAVIFLLLLAATTTTGVEEDELESMLTVLRVRGHVLFSNAIATSDIKYEIFDSNSSFTFFAPTDSNLFALDMINTASDYTSVLRCHVVPLRLNLGELRRLPSGYSLDTLVMNHTITVEIRRQFDDPINLNGVDVVLPGLFYSRDIAVHGLGGILNCLDPDFRSGHDTPSAAPTEPPVLPPVLNAIVAAPPPADLTDFLEPSISGLVEDYITESPVPEPAVFGDYSPGSPPEYSLQSEEFIDRPPSSVPQPAVLGTHSPAPSLQFPPAIFCDNVRAFPPVVYGSPVSPLQSDITGFLQPPTSRCLDSNTTDSPVPAPVDLDGYLPPMNFSGNHSVFPSAVNGTSAPPLPANSTSKGLNNNTIKSPMYEPTDPFRFPESDSSKSSEDLLGFPDDPMSYSPPGLDLPLPDEENDDLGLDEEEKEREDQLLDSTSSEVWTEKVCSMHLDYEDC